MICYHAVYLLTGVGRRRDKHKSGDTGAARQQGLDAPALGPGCGRGCAGRSGGGAAVGELAAHVHVRSTISLQDTMFDITPL